MKNWIKSFGVTSDKWYGKISLTKLDGLCKVDVKEGNTGVLGDTNFPDSEDLHRIKLICILWSDIVDVLIAIGKSHNFCK